MLRFWIKVDPDGPNGCHVWTASPDSDGYGKFWLNGRDRLAHRLVWEWVFGPIPDGLWVLHRCDNRPCVNADHLFLGTHPENMKDMVRKNRQARGSANGYAKLTEQDIPRIRALLKNGLLQREIAAMFGVSQRAISLIKRGKTWSHVA